MIGYIKGKATVVSKEFCFIEAGGIGYRVFISEMSRQKIHLGAPVRLLTYMAVARKRIIPRPVYGMAAAPILSLWRKRKDFWKHTSRPMQKKSNRSLKMQMDTGQAFIRAISALYLTAVILTNISCSRRHHGMIC